MSVYFRHNIYSVHFYIEKSVVMIQSTINRQLTPAVAKGFVLLSCLSMLSCAGLANKPLSASGADKDWPSFGRDFTNQRLSPLTQINQDNVKELKLAWQFKSGVAASFQATPIVTQGVMYVALPFNHVVALDAKTGQALWRYKHERRANWKMCCGPANRGVAVSDGKVFIGTVDARLIALDAKSGKKLWDIDVADDTALTENTSSLSKSDAKSAKEAYGGTGVGIAMAPVVFNGKVIVGITGEFYVLLEPFSNFDVESELGKLGVEVRRTTFISEWTKFSLFLNPLGINEKDRIHRAALPYLKRDIGGDGWESVGEKVLHAKEYDGIIHLAPFTCMPEIIAQNIMPKTKENIPVLTILCDEQMTKTGILTRLEAFVDLLERKRRVRNNDRCQVTT